jgi:hypothetical protein
MRPDRYWLLTNPCYGTWLPGKESGFVGHVWVHRHGVRLRRAWGASET